MYILRRIEANWDVGVSEVHTHTPFGGPFW
jgi:hypothetical protein